MFTLHAELPFSCESDTSVDDGGATLLIALDEQGKADIECDAMVFVDDTVKYQFDITLDYPYEYYAYSDELILRKKADNILPELPTPPEEQQEIPAESIT